MNRVAFYGTIRTADHEVVAELLRDWLKIENLDIKIRIVGVEITFENDTIYLYAHLATASPPGKQFFLLEGNIVATLDVANARLQQLLQLCRGNNVSCDLEYEEVDEEGNLVSEEFTVH
jgi:hypothetical protein